MAEKNALETSFDEEGIILSGGRMFVLFGNDAYLKDGEEPISVGNVKDITFVMRQLQKHKLNAADFDKVRKLLKPEKQLSKIQKGKKAEKDINSEFVERMLNFHKGLPARLGQGVHDGHFYYGLNLIDPTDGETFDAVVSDERQIYVHNQIRHDFGLNYRTPFNEAAIDFPWANDSVKSYIDGEITPRPLREIYNEIREINKEFIEHPDERTHSYLALDIISSYFYTLFDSKGRTFLHAERGSGKTKQSRIYRLLAFNSIWVTKGTESSLFRDIEATNGTVILDNMDKLSDEMKNSLYHWIETGWFSDSKYSLTNKDTMRTQKFSSYSHALINNIYGLDEDTIDKTFTVKMIKNSDSSIGSKKPNPKEGRWQRLRDELRAWTLDNWRELKPETVTAENRAEDVAWAVLVTAKLIGEDVFNEIDALVKESQPEATSVDLENDWGFQIFKGIKDALAGRPQAWVTFGDVVEQVMPVLYPTLSIDDKGYSKAKRYLAKEVSKKIRGIPYFKQFSMRQGRTTVFIKEVDLEKVFKVKGWDKIQNDENTLPYSTNTTTTTQIYPTLQDYAAKQGETGRDGRDGRAGKCSTSDILQKNESQNDEKPPTCNCGQKGVVLMRDGRLLCPDCFTKEKEATQ